MGSSALLLAWEPPLEINGVLVGYRIYYQEVTGESELGLLKEREPRIMKDKLKAKLAGLDPHSKYRVTIKVGLLLFSIFVNINFAQFSNLFYRLQQGPEKVSPITRNVTLIL